MLGVTIHAVERFMDHWRPVSTFDDAKVELETLVQQARSTKKRTARGDAWVHFTTSEYGERICLAVRDNTVITVFSDKAFP